MPRPSLETPSGRRPFSSVSEALRAAYEALSGMENGKVCAVRNRAGKVVHCCWKLNAPSNPTLHGKVQWVSYERLPKGWS